jgi:FAD/FMN-containing dehydrogenase
MQLTDTIPGNAVRTLGADIDGVAIAPGDADYDRARAVWNAMIDRRPAVIARCRSVSDVRTALRFAREHDLPIAVRGGGHNVAGNAVCDGGIVIDLSPMKRIHVDPEARTARVEPGVTLGELDRETLVFGLATPTGLISMTGIAGLTLGGGLGWLARRDGTTCDNLRSAEVVLANGEVVTAGPDDDADLLWALRGGGGNFGIVTSFEYALHPVGPQVLAGAIFHRDDDAPEVLRFYRDFVAGAPDELTVNAVLLTAPEAPFLPSEAHGTPGGGRARGRAGARVSGGRVGRPLRALGRPLADTVAPMPYTAFQTMFDAGYPPGQQNYWKSGYFDGLPDEAIDVALDGARRMTSPLSSFYFQPMGGAIARITPDQAAFGHRDAAFDFNILSVWSDPAETDEHVAWTRELWQAMQPFASGGVYVNNLGDEGPDRVRAAYAPAVYDRLVSLKDRYDPDNVFRMNQNIPPSRGLASSAARGSR